MSEDQVEPRWCGAGYAVIAMDGADAPEWPAPPKDSPCLRPGIKWYAVMLDSSHFAVRFWLCEEHTEMLNEHFAIFDKYGYEPPKRRQP